MERALEELPGVLAVRADLGTKKVHVTYRAGEVSTAAMTEAIGRVDVRLRVRHWSHRLLAWLRRHRP